MQEIKGSSCLSHCAVVSLQFQKDVETLVRIQQVSCKNMQGLEH